MTRMPLAVLTTLALALALAGSASAVEIASQQPLARDADAYSPTIYADDMGSSVAISDSGEVGVAGAPAWGPDAIDSVGEDGAVVVFQRQKNLTPGVHSLWSQRQLIQSTFCTYHDTNELFGSSVDLSADGLTLIAGAPGAPGVLIPPAGPAPGTCAANSTGYVAVFTRASTADPFTLAARIFRDGASADENFGAAVALSDDGTRAVVGAPGVDGADANTGAIVFLDGTSGWSPAVPQQTVSYPTPLTGGAMYYTSFGRTVAISGDGSYALAGTHTYNAPEGTSEFQSYNDCDGIAVPYHRVGGTWTRGYAMVDDQRCGTNDARLTSRFGWAMGLDQDGDTAAVTLPLYSSNDQFGQHGALNVFTRTGGQFAGPGTTAPDLAYSDSAYTDGLNGQAVALDDDASRIIAGAPYRDAPGPQVDQGLVWIGDESNVFGRHWDGVLNITGSDIDPDFAGAAGDLFGSAVAITGDGSSVMVGAPAGGPAQVEIGDTMTNMGPRFGAVWFFDLRETVVPPDLTPDPTPNPTPPPTTPPPTTPGATPTAPSSTPGTAPAPGTTKPAKPRAPRPTWTVRGRTVTARHAPERGVTYTLVARKGSLTRVDRNCGGTCRLRLTRGTWRLELQATNRAGTTTATYGRTITR